MKTKQNQGQNTRATTKNSALTCLHRMEVQHVTCASASKSHPSGYHQRSLKSGGALLLDAEKGGGDCPEKNPPKFFTHTEHCAGPIPPDNRQGQEWQTRPNLCLRVRLISKSKSLEKVISEWEGRGGVSVWVPCMLYWRETLQRQALPFARGIELKLIWDQFLGKGEDRRGKERGVGMESGFETFERRKKWRTRTEW